MAGRRRAGVGGPGPRRKSFGTARRPRRSPPRPRKRRRRARSRADAAGPGAAGTARPASERGARRESRPPSRGPTPASGSNATQLDELVGLAGELAVISDNLMGLREFGGADRWLHALESLQRVSREIRDTTLDLRMVPVDELFSRFPRVVRDLADRSGKRDRAADRRPGHAAGPDDRRAAQRADGPPDPQRRRPRARDPRGARGGTGRPRPAGSRSRPATKGTGWRSGSRTTAGGSTATRSSGRGSRWRWSRRARRPTIPGS